MSCELIKQEMHHRRIRGFSLIEMMITVTIILIVSGVALMAMQPALKYGRVNNAYNITMAAIRQARDYAVAQRQQYSVTFNNGAVPNTIVITQTGNGNVAATYQLPLDVTFTAVGGIPTAANAVPDGFGAGANAIDFDQGIVGGVQNIIYFLPDGTGQDVNGNINNGVLYIARAGELYSSHAITFWGATGRIRGWKLLQNGVNPYWRQN
ncbi:MAG: prepilin-type N-terminal cleavage/methylation domain-containing protein [Acidobacteriaceae bacterium]|nr:prepilin-type N-terminal cleavage/methylation domain-containing protein [Acidobacteriaceae bacterium]